MELTNKSPTVKVTFSGGFHNTKPVMVIAKIDSRGQLWIGWSRFVRLQKIFCGRSGCQCGGVHRASMHFGGKGVRTNGIFPDGDTVTLGYLVGSDAEQAEMHSMIESERALMRCLVV